MLSTGRTLSGLISVIIDGRQHFDTPVAFAQFIRRAGKKAGATVDPCAHAIQLRRIFKAFLYQDGRLQHPKVRRKTHGPGRERYECVTKGQPYQALVDFARNLETTPEIVALRNGVCPIKGCTHIGL
jgi:hypothetical protein